MTLKFKGSMVIINYFEIILHIELLKKRDSLLNKFREQTAT